MVYDKCAINAFTLQIRKLDPADLYKLPKVTELELEERGFKTNSKATFLKIILF